MIPSIGPHYKEQWIEEDKRLAVLVKRDVQNPSTASNREYAEIDDTIHEGDLRIGPLSERLLSALVREGLVPDQADEDEEPVMTTKIIPRIRNKTDLSLYEEKLQAELMHLGLVSKEETHQDNEIINHLQLTQQKLREQIQVNARRKRLLLGVAEGFMGYQEYNALLDDVNKSIESAYIRRFVSYFTNDRKQFRRN